MASLPGVEKQQYKPSDTSALPGALELAGAVPYVGVDGMRQGMARLVRKCGGSMPLSMEPGCPPPVESLKVGGKNNSLLVQQNTNCNPTAPI